MFETNVDYLAGYNVGIKTDSYNQVTNRVKLAGQ